MAAQATTALISGGESPSFGALWSFRAQPPPVSTTEPLRLALIERRHVSHPPGVKWIDPQTPGKNQSPILRRAIVQPRIKNPALAVPGAMEAMQKLGEASRSAGVPDATLLLVVLRASQINGCSVCVDMHSRELKAAGESDQRILTLAAWRETPYFSDAERAALALTEAATRVADRPDPVSDEVWDDAARHYDERQLAALVISIASINAWNRINAATRQITGDWIEQWIAPPGGG
jgi:AhpD family alkylhydroperoxidase